MDPNFLLGAIIGLIVGFTIAVKLNAGVSQTRNETTNEIGKLKTKGDNSPIDADQVLDQQQPEKKERKGFLKNIFKRKKR